MNHGAAMLKEVPGRIRLRGIFESCARCLPMKYPTLPSRAGVAGACSDRIETANVSRFARLLSSKILLFALLVLVPGHDACAGWNYIRRNRCAALKKYWVQAHVGYRMPGSGGTIGSSTDSGCTWAQVGPLQYFDGPYLLAEAYGYAGNGGLTGYAHAWQVQNTGAGTYKIGIAAQAGEEAAAQRAPSVVRPGAVEGVTRVGSNLIVLSDVRFNEAKSGRGPTLTVAGLGGYLVATEGYSVLEIVAWKAADDVGRGVQDTKLTREKVLWRGKAIVHGNRLTVEGSLSSKIFTVAPASSGARETVYSLRDVEVVIPLPPGTKLDEVALTINGDAGDESVLRTAY